jgi:bifunctional DNA-binding transcriptional regulator/antitoxin component of YhaV-PrlF toxin-antitoxin module
MISVVRAAGEATLSGKNQVSLPAYGVRQLGWQRGDRLIVETIGDDMMVLIRRPADWVEAFAGKLTDVFGTHDENLALIESERQSWTE